MTAIHSTIIDDTALSGPALRLHLLELYLDGSDMPDQALALAQAAERWVLGDVTGDDIPVIIHGDEKNDDAIDWHQQREKLLRWWLAGKKISEMEKEFGAGKSAIHSAAKRYGFSATFRRGSRGFLYYTPVPLDAPLPPEAQQLLDMDFLRVKHKDLLTIIRSVSGEGVTLSGRLLADRLGCSQVTASIHVRELIDAGLVANTGTSSKPNYVVIEDAGNLAVAHLPEPPVTPKTTAEPVRPQPAPAREMLPEDKLRLSPEADAHVDMDTVVQWLSANGCKALSEEAPGFWFLEGAVLSDRDLLKRANRARKALKLPMFSVRGM